MLKDEGLRLKGVLRMGEQTDGRTVGRTFVESLSQLKIHFDERLFVIFHIFRIVSVN